MLLFLLHLISKYLELQFISYYLIIIFVFQQNKGNNGTILDVEVLYYTCEELYWCAKTFILFILVQFYILFTKFLIYGIINMFNIWIFKEFNNVMIT